MQFANAFLLMTLLSCANAHLCLLSPTQRGTISGLNKEASPDCILLKSPCGGRPSQHSGTVAFKAQSNITVIFQKNLDHYTPTSPGYFTVSFGVDDRASSFKEVARVSDKGEPNLHLYTVTVPVPDMGGHPHQILQVSYVTKNPNAPPAFYQCADMMLYS